MHAQLVALSLACVAYTACAAGWSTHDTEREAVFDGLLVVDTMQTHNIAHAPTYQEENPILGPHPSNGSVNRYMAACALGHLAVSYLLPERYRPYWQYVTIGIEGGIVAHNLSIGVGVPF